jgi:hypothetical protein
VVRNTKPEISTGHRIICLGTRAYPPDIPPAPLVARHSIEGADMPLTKSTSKQAFKKNVEREVQAGKPPKQAVAIAYSVKRQAEKKGKK